MHSEFKQRPLRTMNAALQEAGRQLSRITPDRARCLAVVTRCQDLIDWLKETISGTCIETVKSLNHIRCIQEEVLLLLFLNCCSNGIVCVTLGH